VIHLVSKVGFIIAAEHAAPRLVVIVKAFSGPTQHVQNGMEES
jgi:hypothetical protein